MSRNNAMSVQDAPVDGLQGVVLGGGTLQRTQTQYSTAIAVQRPRNLNAVKSRLIDEANHAGDSFYYGWAAKGQGGQVSQIEGPSVDLAMAAVRCWGNCAVELGQVQDDQDAWIFVAYLVDLETGTTIGRQFRQSKSWAVHGRLDDARKEDVRFQIGQSKAVRNVILNALPKFLIDSAMKAAKEGVKKRATEEIKDKGMAAVVDHMLRALSKHGVKEEHVLKKLGIANRSAIDVDMLVALRGDLVAIVDGKERASDLFEIGDGGNGQTNASAAADGTQSKTDELREKLASKREGATVPTDQQQTQPAQAKPWAESAKERIGAATTMAELGPIYSEALKHENTEERGDVLGRYLLRYVDLAKDAPDKLTDFVDLFVDSADHHLTEEAKQLARSALGARINPPKRGRQKQGSLGLPESSGNPV